VQLAFGSAIAILLLVGGFAYRSIVVSSENGRWVQHTHEVLENLQELQFAMETVSSSVRGYLLVGDETYLDRYRAARSSLEQHTAAVRELTSTTRYSSAGFLVLEKLAAARLDRADENINLIRNPRDLCLKCHRRLRAGPGLQIMVEYRAIVGQMQDEERRLLVLRDADAKRSTAGPKLR
jgi:CHASE3 domain sensor protein